MIIKITLGHVFTRRYTYTYFIYNILNSLYCHSYFDNYPITVSINNKIVKLSRLTCGHYLFFLINCSRSLVVRYRSEK